nr:MAG TPA: hypothetical protein [Caudoviricetes sp.]
MHIKLSFRLIPISYFTLCCFKMKRSCKKKQKRLQNEKFAISFVYEW